MLHSARRLAARAFAPLLLSFGLVLAALAWLPSAAVAQAPIDAALEKLTTDSY